MIHSNRLFTNTHERGWFNFLSPTNGISVALGLLSTAFLLGFNWASFQKIDRFSLELESKSLHNGKSVSLQGEVYFQPKGSLLVTHIRFPFEKYTKSNVLGEFVEYDFRNNRVSRQMEKSLSSRYSFFHIFFNGQTSDMGLLEQGFKLTNTRLDKKMVITEWKPTSTDNVRISKAELVHENNLPIYLAFFDAGGKPIQKSFYSNYNELGNIVLPFTLTEFEYYSSKDSVITRRNYSKPKINSEVTDTWFKFSPPANARLNPAQKP